MASRRRRRPVEAHQHIRRAVRSSGSRLALSASARGNQLLGTFLDRPEVDVVAIADVDDRHTSETAEKIKKERGSTWGHIFFPPYPGS